MVEVADGNDKGFCGGSDQTVHGRRVWKESMELSQVIRFIENLGAVVPQNDRAAQVVHAVIAQSAAGDEQGAIVWATKNMLNTRVIYIN